MFALEERLTRGTEKGTNDENEEDSVRFSPEMVVERIKVNLEPLHAQISALTEMMDFLIQGSSARKFNAVCTR